MYYYITQPYQPPRPRPLTSYFKIIFKVYLLWSVQLLFPYPKRQNVQVYVSEKHRSTKSMLNRASFKLSTLSLYQLWWLWECRVYDTTDLYRLEFIFVLHHAKLACGYLHVYFLVVHHFKLATPTSTPSALTVQIAANWQEQSAVNKQERSSPSTLTQTARPLRSPEPCSSSGRRRKKGERKNKEGEKKWWF